MFRGSARERNAIMEGNDKSAVRQVVDDAYIRGIHEEQDEAAVRAGFHPDFTMYVRRQDRVETVTLDQWFPRVEKLKANDPELWNQPTIRHYESIDVHGDTACVRMRVFKGDRYFSTDFMLLYRVDGRWRIVSKAFEVSE